MLVPSLRYKGILRSAVNSTCRTTMTTIYSKVMRVHVTQTFSDRNLHSVLFYFTKTDYVEKWQLWRYL